MGEGYYANDDAAQNENLSDIQNSSTVRGPLGLDPLNFTQFVFFCLMCWISYLFIPRGIRFTYFGSYPKRYAWSARSKRRRRQQQQGGYGGGISREDADSLISFDETTSTMNTNQNPPSGKHSHIVNRNGGTAYNTSTNYLSENQYTNSAQVPEDEIIDLAPPPMQQQTSSSSSMLNNKTQLGINTSTATPQITQANNQSHTPFSSGASTFNDEIAISTTMQQLRDVGVQIIAHGSKGKPKTVRLVLTENAITWRTESTKRKNKVGKPHQVPLSHIMYVDVGKQTTALRRVENASLADNVCLSLLTKDGSLDLEASSSQERDALVNCFSLVLDEVHAQNWRDVYRAPSSDLPSSFDEFDVGNNGQRMEV